MLNVNNHPYESLYSGLLRAGTYRSASGINPNRTTAGSIPGSTAQTDSVAYSSLYTAKREADSLRVMGSEGSSTNSESTPRTTRETTDSTAEGGASTSQANAGKTDEAGKNGGGKAKSGADELSDDEKRMVEQLKARDQEVRQHEQAHQSAGAGYAGAASFTYQKGPDGKNYAIGGEVSIDTSDAGTPEATAAKMRIVRAAALAPANPSGQDLSVAAAASKREMEAMREAREIKAEEAEEKREEAKAAAEKAQGKNGESEAAGKTGEDNPPAASESAATQNTAPSRSDESAARANGATAGGIASLAPRPATPGYGRDNSRSATALIDLVA